MIKLYEHRHEPWSSPWTLNIVHTNFLEWWAILPPPHTHTLQIGYDAKNENKCIKDTLRMAWLSNIRQVSLWTGG